jgi:hypothetical protein
MMSEMTYNVGFEFRQDRVPSLSIVFKPGDSLWEYVRKTYNTLILSGMEQKPNQDPNSLESRTEQGREVSERLIARNPQDFLTHMEEIAAGRSEVYDKGVRRLAESGYRNALGSLRKQRSGVETTINNDAESNNDNVANKALDVAFDQRRKSSRGISESIRCIREIVRTNGYWAVFQTNDDFPGYEVEVGPRSIKQSSVQGR